MKLFRNRNDRGFVGGLALLLGASVAVGAITAPAGFGARVLASTLRLSEPALAHAATADATGSIVRRPTDLPASLEGRGPETVRINLETIERMGDLADGTSYRYWTFNGQVPGPFVRVRVGDTVEVNLTNHEDSWMQHNVDFHAVTGPGAGRSVRAPPATGRGRG